MASGNEANEGMAKIVIGKRISRNRVCACFCCDRFEGNGRSNDQALGSIIPDHDGITGQAPSRLAREDVWLDRLEKAVENLTKVAGNLQADLAN